MDDKKLFEYISKVTELNDISEHMQDEDLDKALDLIIKLTVKDIPTDSVSRHIVRMSAMSAVFKLRAKHYMLFEKDKENNAKKNVYMSVADSLQEIANSLKYMIKSF